MFIGFCFSSTVNLCTIGANSYSLPDLYLVECDKPALLTSTGLGILKNLREIFLLQLRSKRYFFEKLKNKIWLSSYIWKSQFQIWLGRKNAAPPPSPQIYCRWECSFVFRILLLLSVCLFSLIRRYCVCYCYCCWFKKNTET